ncbi:hypothetical protein AGLY_002062, partial [Aphis glycines]
CCPQNKKGKEMVLSVSLTIDKIIGDSYFTIKDGEGLHHNTLVGADFNNLSQSEDDVLSIEKLTFKIINDESEEFVNDLSQSEDDALSIEKSTSKKIYDESKESVNDFEVILTLNFSYKYFKYLLKSVSFSLAIESTIIDMVSLKYPEDSSNTLPTSRLEIKQRVLKGPFQPHLKLFSRSKIGNYYRSFQEKWYDSFKWLEYSIDLDRVFCFSCRLFMHSNLNAGHQDPTFSKTGFNNWHIATSRFIKHQNSKSHMISLSSMATFLNSDSIDIVLNKSKEVELSKREAQRMINRSIMHRLIDIALCLAKNGKSLRGHNENTDSVSKGLFLEMVDLLKKYDSLLIEHLENGPKNASYISNRIQNDILLFIQNFMKRNISMVSIIADETSDCSHFEQLPVCVLEHFIGVKRLLSVNAQSVYDSLTEAINEIGIDWKNVIAVCFDGAATMAGSCNGVQAKIKENKPSIYYVHCYGHYLNLILVSSLGRKNNVIFDFFGVLQIIYSFIEASPVRHAILERISKEINLKLKSLKTLSTTKWACRSEAIEAVKNNYSASLLCLEEISNKTNLSEVRAKAKGLIFQMKTFNLIFSMHILSPVLIMIQKVSASLQSPNLDLLSAVSLVKSLREHLSKLRSDDNNFIVIYNEIVSVCQRNLISIPEVKKRKFTRKIDENSTHYTSGSQPGVRGPLGVRDKIEEMRYFTFYPMLDEMIRGIDERFSQETLNLIVSMGKMLKLQTDDADIKILSEAFNLKNIHTEIKLLINILDIESICGSSNTNISKWLDSGTCKTNNRRNQINIDSTPNIAHIDQLSFIFRYVKDGLPIERF